MVALTDVITICWAEYMVQLYCIGYDLKHLHNVESRFQCPQTFLDLEFQCWDDVSELN